MRHAISQFLKMKQKMALTPQMRQSMQLLAMSTKELGEYIDTLAEKNPFLKKEFDEKTSQRASADYTSPRTPHDLTDYGEKTIAQEENPRLLLISNLRTLGLTDKAMEIAEYLVYEIDENGYIDINLEEAAKDFSSEPEEIEKILSIIQAMDPPGIGARDLRECLQLQLKRKGKENSLEYNIVTNFVNELAKNDSKKISKSLNIDRTKVIRAINNIKKLNPRPASTVFSKQAEPIIPDLIARIKKDKIYLEINREWLPRLRLYNPYEHKLELVKDPEVKKFLKENMNAGKQLIDNLKRREETMCRVADHILRQQKDAIKNGLSHIKHLTIKDIAETLNFHPSTISRTISNKYIQINDKVVPLRALLSHSIRKQNGDVVSKTSIKSRIKELVDGEDKKRPLTDSDIKKRLEEEDIYIKRRTVAKYRESLRILPIHLRKDRS